MFLFIYSSIYSGEDSIHEGTTAENAHALNWRDGHLNYGTREVGLSETRISRDYAELGMAGAPSLTGFSGLVEWDFTPDNVPIPRRPIASGTLCDSKLPFGNMFVLNHDCSQINYEHFVKEQQDDKDESFLYPIVRER
ncbi:unnamed protein product [Schistosoma curassoni]|uniref:DUF1559 domain-containing protein n=1 Tax=Schistosoma curassoni TaxID=6186 RepID=A0A183KPR0_9TREM|nr:unnamed protein product [Schistosoma curassoni]